MVLIDTTVWVDYFQGAENSETDWLNTELDRQRLGLTDVILCEVLQGVRDDAVARVVERSLLTLEVFETGGVATGSALRGLVPRRWPVLSASTLLTSDLK